MAIKTYKNLVLQYPPDPKLLRKLIKTGDESTCPVCHRINADPKLIYDNGVEYIDDTYTATEIRAKYSCDTCGSEWTSSYILTKIKITKGPREVL